MKTDIFQILNLRTEWEQIVSSYKFIPKDSTISSLRTFIEVGARGNRFRDDYSRAVEIAEIIIKSYEDENFNISSVCGKEIKAI